MKDKRGFTLIELIVVLGLVGVVMSVVMTFFIANYKSYETINTESEVQYQSQYIINFMTNKILEAKSFEGKIGRQYIIEYADGKIATFEIEGSKIKYIFDSQPPIFVGNYVKELEIKQHGSNSNEVKIILELDKGKNGSYPAEQVVYMRNSSN